MWFGQWILGILLHNKTGPELKPEFHILALRLATHPHNRHIPARRYKSFQRDLCVTVHSKERLCEVIIWWLMVWGQPSTLQFVGHSDTTDSASSKFSSARLLSLAHRIWCISPPFPCRPSLFRVRIADLPGKWKKAENCHGKCYLKKKKRKKEHLYASLCMCITHVNCVTFLMNIFHWYWSQLLIFLQAFSFYNFNCSISKGLLLLLFTAMVWVKNGI